MRNKNMFLSFVILLLGLCSHANSQKNDIRLGSDLPMLKGALIEVLSYDSASQTFKVRDAKFVAEGDSVVTAEGLSKAIPSLDLDRIKRAPERLQGQQFQIDNNLPTLFPKEKAARQKHFQGASEVATKATKSLTRR